ncbi:MAG TPA: UDP-3-O-(3-hydroxymyristoyl)glucosamine N-acyltransferase [Candidatus Omnitrophota bacterium]|nr:UDP-3-O-(3-hydroxymyristoyl)glucosamine N-acyltransferase [Candidatus Omnitrophota bacterium]
MSTTKTLAEIAKFVGGKVSGDPSVVIRGFSGLQEAQIGDLTFLANMKYAGLLEKTKASAVIVAQDIEDVAGKNFIKTDNPSLAFSKALLLFVEKHPDPVNGVHPTAMVAEGARLSKDVNIGPYVVIEDGVEIGSATTIGAGTFVGYQTRIGKDCLIYPNVTIREQGVLGDRVIVHSGTVIGSDGFGFVTEGGVHHKIPQIGTVEIHDDVEIGANVTIDRARFDKTIIGAGTKIDNLVQIAHNVRIGRGCIIVSQVGISGSTVIEDYVVLGGQVGVAGHLTVGSGTMVAAQSGVASSIPPKSIFFGSPAQPHMHAKRVNACLKDLPEHVRTIRDLKERIAELEKKMSS